MSWLASVSGNILLFCLVFGMSATVDIRSMHNQVRNVRALAMGVFCQFIILPFLGFLVVRFLGLEESLGLTLLVVTSSPGGSYSNWWCSLFNGDLALSVTMTAMSTILSMIFLPLNLLFYTKMAYHKAQDDEIVSNLDWSALFMALAIVMCAIILGLTLSSKVQDIRFQHFANGLGNTSGLLLILFSALMTNTGDSDSKIWSRHWTFYVGVSIPCLGGLILANVLATMAQLPKPERVTVAIECCYQNVGIATSLALTMFKGQNLNEAMGVPFFYGVIEALFVGIYCVGAWKCGWTKAPADASICKIIFTSYEVLELEEAAAAAAASTDKAKGDSDGKGGTIEVVDHTKKKQTAADAKADYVLMEDGTAKSKQLGKDEQAAAPLLDKSQRKAASDKNNSKA